MSTSVFLDVVIVWELVAIALTLLVSGYLIFDLLLAVVRPASRPWVPRDASLPFVSVVIPVYNEPREILLGTLDSWRAVRYPRFELIVADDSTEPVDIRDYGVRVLHRESREGFKGGALRNAFAHLHPESEWMFVFDADYVVEPDVLVRFTAHFRAGVGGIQGMMAMGRNDHANILTRFSEALHAVAGTILAGRYRHRGFVGVQGCVQAYRVDAVRSIGGIAPEPTANEDLDTTFRLRKAGWKIVYDASIIGHGLAPERYGVFFSQITRWTATTVREYRRHWRSYLGSRAVPVGEKVDSFLFLLTWVNSLVVTPTLAFLPWALLHLTLIPIWLAIVITLLPFLVFMIPTLAHHPVRVGLLGWLWYYVLLIPGYFVMFRAAFIGMFTEPGFNRTPKDVSGPVPSRPQVVARIPSAPPPEPETSSPSAVQPVCKWCDRPLTNAEVLFFALSAMDVEDLRCRRCLGDEEWTRFTRREVPWPSARLPRAGG